MADAISRMHSRVTFFFFRFVLRMWRLDAASALLVVDMAH